MAAGLNRPAGTVDVATAFAPYRNALDKRTAAHLLRRAGFGGSPEEIARVASMTPGAAAEMLTRIPDARSVPPPANVFDPLQAFFMLRQQYRGDQTQMREAQMGLRKQMRDSIISMQAWWLNRMLTTPAPLQEKMTLFFHGHFTTAAIQKGVWPNYVWQQNQLLRGFAFGNLRNLTVAVSKDPAMLYYLDNARSAKAAPNENYARELMELFTLGRGNYTEDDVRESARAFTGWSVNRRDGTFVFNARAHDDGSKTFLGQTGNFDGGDIIDIIYRQPACARFWSTSLLNMFVYNDPEPALVDAFANVIRAHDFNLGPVMSTLLQSNVFYSPRAYRALVKSPAEFVIGTHKTLGLQTLEPRSLGAMRQMGQILFYPPNVAGWPGGTNWVTSQTMIARQNFVAALVNSTMMQQATWVGTMPTDARQASERLVAMILQGDAPGEASDQLMNFLDGSETSALKTFSAENFQERVRGAAYLTMAMPAYQLS